MKYNGFVVPDKEVDTIVDKLECSIAEACEMWLADHDKVTNDEQEKATKDAQKNGRHYEHSTRPRKKTERERKVDETKKFLLEIIENALNSDENVFIYDRKNEVDLNFTYFGDDYTVKLTKHRKKK